MPEENLAVHHARKWFSWKSGLAVGGLSLIALAAGAQFLLGGNGVPLSKASGGAAQSAVGSARDGRAVSAAFLRVPKRGNLLVAVASNRLAASVPTPTGWSVAIDESAYSPGQAVFFKIAGEDEPKDVHVVGYDRDNQLILQLFEYSGVDRLIPLDRAASDAGKGREVHSGSVDGTVGEFLYFSALTIDDAPIRFTEAPTEDFDLRSFERSFGGGSITAATADRLVSGEGGAETVVPMNRDARWRGQIVAFRKSTDVERATDADAKPVDVRLEFDVSNEAPVSAERIAYTLRVTNDGPGTATDVIVKSTLPIGLFFDGAEATEGKYLPGTGIWQILELAPGQTSTLVQHGMVDEDLLGVSIIHSAKLLSVNEEDRVPSNNEAYAVIEVKGGGGKVAGACLELGEPSFVISEDAETTPSRSVLISGSASGATYLLVAEDARRQVAQIVPLETDVPFELSAGEGEKTLFAWLGNACATAFVIQDSILFEEVEEVEEEEEIEEEAGLEDEEI